ncbi:hypothetical protein BGZ49_009149 [Haplosporangium sp. Z 27]|nr:hypothetical protein BGZ49_009149 [Haplosporangium sp. Z 27]
MLAGDRPRPRFNSTYRHSFHGESSSSSTHNTLTKPWKGANRQSFSAGGSSSLNQSSLSASMQQQTPARSRQRSSSTASTTASALASAAARGIVSPESSTLTKEKEFMTNVRILAMNNVLDSFALSSHARQGFYGKQLKIIGSAPSSPSSTGAELDIVIKIHVIENTWTTCPLLPSSTILHRWKVTLLDSPNHHLEGENIQDDFLDHGHSKDRKRSSWIHTTVERAETISPAPSPTYEKRAARPLSTSSLFSAYSGQNVAQQTHVAVISNALCFVANKSGDYLVNLSIHAPFVEGASNHGFLLSQIPKCRSNFIKFRIDTPTAEEDIDNNETKEHKEREDAFENISEGFEFRINPPVKTLDESHLNPESDEDAEFWLEVQELLVGRDEFVEKLTASGEFSDSHAQLQEQSTLDSSADGVSSKFEIAGCFSPSSSLYVSWMPQSAVNFVQDVEQEVNVRIAGLPDQTKSSTLLQHRKRKDPAVSLAVDHTDQDDDPIEHLEMEDGDLIISLEDTIKLNIQELGWKQPFVDLIIDPSDTQHRQISDVSLIEITGDSVEDYEPIFSENSEQIPSEFEITDKESTDHDRHLPTVYRVKFFTGTKGATVVHVRARVVQTVSVGYGKDISCNIPKIQVHGASLDKGWIHIHMSNDLVIQQYHNRNLESPPTDGHPVQDGSSSLAGHPPTSRFKYQSSDYQLSFIVHRYQAISRIARIEKIKAEIGVSGQQQPGFARVLLSNVVLPQQDDSYLRVYQLDGVEIWNILVDGKPCAKSTQFTDRKSGGQRTIMIPIPEEASESEHQVEISYGFNTVDRDQDEELDDDTANPTIKLVVPGFNLPVGEYVVVASLPKLAKDMDYDEPVGDFEVTSKLGEHNQRKTITYGAYMTLGRPKLSIKASKVVTTSRVLQQIEELEALAPVVQPEQLEQITRTHAHTNFIAHDPQQPTFNAGHVVSQASQRHPQQPLDSQNPLAEHALDGEIPPVLGVRSHGIEGGVMQTTGQTSNLSPHVGVDSFSPKFWLAQLQCQAGFWWRLPTVILASFLLIVMIINVSNFQDTMSTSLDIVQIPIWQRPFAAIGRLWYENSRHRESGHYSEPDIDIDEFFAPEETVTEFLKVETTKTTPASSVVTTHDLEIRGGSREGSKEDFRSDDGDVGNDEMQSKQSGLLNFIQMLKRMVGAG